MSGRHSYRGATNGRGQRTNTKLGVRPVDLKALERLDSVQAELAEFRDARGWGEQHTPAHLARALMVEAGELNALFLWGAEPPEARMREEAADVLIYALNLCNAMGWDAAAICREKMATNAVKYPA